MNDFIEAYDKVFTEEYCTKVIGAFDRLHNSGFTWNRQDEGIPKTLKEDDAFTHTHRGNPPLSNTKYIMTGWLEY